MKSDSLSAKVYAELRRKILSNQLTAHTRLKEDIWAQQSGTNRAAVREALNRLLGEKLVYLGQKGGYFVAGFSVEEIHHIRELRQILELGAVRLCIDRLRKEQLQTLARLCDDFTRMIREEYYNGALEADIRFHETLIAFSENPKLIEAYTLSRIPLFHQKLGESQMQANDYVLTDKEHRSILKALQQKNLAAAEKALIKHFERGEAFVLADS